MLYYGDLFDYILNEILERKEFLNIVAEVMTPQIAYFYPRHPVKEYKDKFYKVKVLDPPDLTLYLEQIRNKIHTYVVPPFNIAVFSRVFEHNTVDTIRYMFHLMRPFVRLIISVTPDMKRISEVLSTLDPNTWDFQRLNLDIFNEPSTDDPYSVHKTWTTPEVLSKIAKTEHWDLLYEELITLDYQNSYHNLLVFGWR